MATSGREHETSALRVLAWIAATIAVALLGWYGSAAVIRSRARDRIEAEIARVRAAGEPTTQAEAWGPSPPSAENGALLLDAARNALRLVDGGNPETFAGVHDWLASPEGRAACGERWGGRRDAVEPWIQVAVHGGSTQGAPEYASEPACAAGVRRAWLATHAEALAAARTAADLGVLRPVSGYVSMLSLRAACSVLLVAALAALDEGDGARARVELARVLALTRALGGQPSLLHAYLRAFELNRALAFLQRLVETDHLVPELAALDLDLERAGPWSIHAPAILADRALAIELYEVAGPAGWSPAGSWDPWLRPDAEVGRWRALARAFADAGEAIDLARLAPAAALADPRWMVARMRESSSGAPWLRPMSALLRDGESLADAELVLVLARAALRARFEGVEAARAFLAVHVDPFTGATPALRVEDDGTVVIESPRPGVAGGPPVSAYQARLRVWRVPH